MPTGDFIDALVRNTNTQVFGGVPDPYGAEGAEVDVFSKAVFRVPLPEEPACSPLEVKSLQAFVDYIVAPDDGEAITDGLIVHILGHADVKLVSGIRGVRRGREVYIHAQATSALETAGFKYGIYQPVGDFIPLLQSLFEESGDRSTLLDIFSSVTSEAIRTSDDDGLTQVVSTRRGISLKRDTAIPKQVNLRPFRTFRELSQPSSPFLLRLKDTGPDNPPQAALWECDGGGWKLDAISSIRHYIRERLDANEESKNVLVLG